MSRGLIVQRASSDNSVSSMVSEERPIIMNRLVDDTGCRIVGGVATLGSLYSSVSRSCTICRALMMSVPRLKISVIVDRPVTERDRVDWSHGTPFRRSSRPRVMRFSTSSADSPTASVCTSTVGGANSGNTSIGIRPTSRMPTTRMATAAASRR